MADIVAGTNAIPRLPGFDSSLAFLREGYAFIGNRCDDLGTEAFRTRIMLRPVTCIRGAEAVREFYRPGRMTRRGAMPSSAVALLQGKQSVQALDGAAHRVRKEMFLDLMSRERLDMGRDILAEEWQVAARDWAGRTIVLRDEIDGIMTRTALRWCGIAPEGENVAARAKEFTSMVRHAGSIGPTYLRARQLRVRSERWARGVIRRARKKGAEGAVAALAHHRDEDGQLLSAETAAVELINLLRPIVAVGRYVVDAAHAMHVHREAVTDFLNESPSGPERAVAVAEEVRRLYPFFPAIGGRVVRPFEWRGHSFGQGDWLLLDLYGTTHDPTVWEAPESFRPGRHLAKDRPEDAMVPQGGGNYRANHRCPGEWLSLVLLSEAVLQLRNLDYSVPDQALDIPLDAFPAGPRDGMRLSVAQAARH